MSLEIANQHFEDRNYFLAIEEYSKVLKRDLTFSKEIVEAFGNFIESYVLIDEVKKSFKVKRELSQYLYHNKKFQESIENSLEILDEVKCSETLLLLSECYEQMGNIEFASNWSEKYIKHLSCFNNFFKIKEHLLERVQRGRPLSLVEKEILLRAYVVLGDASALELLELSLEHRVKFYTLFQNDFKRNLNYWKRIPYFKELQASSVENRKDFILATYELIMNEEYDLNQLERYSKVYKAKTLALSLNKLGKEIDCEGWNNDQVDLTEFDFATDLLSEKTRDDVSYLVNRINFLLKNDKSDNEIETLLIKLKEKDPNHTLVKNIYEKSYQKKASVFAGKKHLKKKYKFDHGFEKEVSVIKGILNARDEVIFDNLEQYVNLLIQMDFPVLACDLLEKHKEQWVLVENNLNFYYLLINSLLESDSYNKALIYVDEVLETQPLAGEDHLCFLFLKAQCHEKIDNKKAALDIYRIIYSIDKKYRAVDKRIRSFE